MNFMFRLMQSGDYRKQVFTIIDESADKKAYTTRLRNGELEFLDHFGVLVWCIRYNNTALLVNIEEKKRQKAYFEVYHYTNGGEELVCKIDYLPDYSAFLGVKFKPSDKEMFIYKHSNSWYEILNDKYEIQSLMYREDKRLPTIFVSSYEEDCLHLHTVLFLVADTIWNIHRFEKYRIDYRTNFVKTKPKKPKMFAFNKSKKELFGNDF